MNSSYRQWRSNRATMMWWQSEGTQTCRSGIQTVQGASSLVNKRKVKVSPKSRWSYLFYPLHGTQPPGPWPSQDHGRGADPAGSRPPPRIWTHYSSWQFEGSFAAFISSLFDPCCGWFWSKESHMRAVTTHAHTKESCEIHNCNVLYVLILMQQQECWVKVWWWHNRWVSYTHVFIML